MDVVDEVLLVVLEVLVDVVDVLVVDVLVVPAGHRSQSSAQSGALIGHPLRWQFWHDVWMNLLIMSYSSWEQGPQILGIWTMVVYIDKPYV